MLETEDIDDDYFTPASSTSLANIFGKTHTENGTENESLKYTPPKSTKLDEQKATQCIYACALVGYEWSNGAYATRGKLGFAILKIIKTGIHNFVVYDSHKTTLSCATLSSTFEVILKENVYFSYHDNQSKYWSLYASENELKKITEILKSFNISVKYCTIEHGEQAQISKIPASVDNTQASNAEKESDTDSSVNRRTKMSILNRMASMGQSVLPSHAAPTDITSDSSDTSESHYKSVRHKPVKTMMKRISSDKNLVECQSLLESSHQNIEQSSHSVPLFTYVNGQLVPVTNSNIISCNSSGNEMSYFISEQRVSNSEIRINMSRLTDKVDQILGKLAVVEDKDKCHTTNNFQLEILQKLLAEYENKIKRYEEFIKANEKSNSFTASVGSIPKEVLTRIDEDLSEKVTYLENLNREKDDKIAQLQIEYKLLNGKLLTVTNEENKNKEQLTEEIIRLKEELNSKNELLMESIQKSKEIPQVTEVNSNIGDKIKNIMNDTFHSISVNFENDEQYSGESVKVITASIIKKVTIEALNDV